MKSSKRPPIKRREALVPYSRDHHHGLLLVWKVRQGLKKGAAPERIAAYVHHFYSQHLLPHFTEEENHLFIALDQGGAMLQEALDDHAYLGQKAQELASTPSENSLTLFADRLERHIRFEERVLFQHLQEVMPTEMPADYQGNIPDDDDWPDAFWLDAAAPEKLRIDPASLEWIPGKVNSFYGKELLNQPHATFKLVKAGPMSSYPRHTHPDRTEFVYVLEGTPLFEIGGETFTAKPHEFYLFPAQIPHAIVNDHPDPAIMLVGGFFVNAPAP